MISIHLGYFENLDILPLLYLFNQSGSLQGDRCNHPFLRIEKILSEAP